MKFSSLQYCVILENKKFKVRNIGMVKKKRDKIGMGYESLHNKITQCAMPTS